MKKLGMFALAILLVQGLIFSAPAPKKQVDAWKKLDKMRTIPRVNIYNEKIRKIKKRYERPTVVILKPIREALEKAGIDETVSIEVRANKKLVAKLGTYTPTVTMKDGKKTVSFNSIPPGLRTLKSLTWLPGEYNTNFTSASSDQRHFRPRRWKLYFKNKDNKTKAKLYVRFYYGSNDNGL